MIQVRQNNNLYEITFRYDPNVIALIKNVPGREWISSRKIWTIPQDKLGWLINEFKGTVYEKFVQIQSEENLNVNETLDATPSVDIPNINLDRIPYYVKKGAKPYNHQLDFMKWAISRQQSGNMKGFILADDQGLAKTNEVMNLALYNKKQYGFKHCLIICCINSSKYNWERDIYEHTEGVERPYIIGSRLKRDKVSVRCDTGSKEKLEDLKCFRMYGNEAAEELPYFIILNIEALRYKEGKVYPIANELIRLINAGQINMIAIDEIHKNASPGSSQGKRLLDIKKATGSKVEWIPMTGTPITKRPTDVYTPLKLIDGHLFTSYWTWCREFCLFGGFGDKEVVGYKNIPRLKSMLQNNMIRRLKSDVLDLPPKIYYTQYVENTPYQRRLYELVENEIRKEKEKILEGIDPRAKFLRLRQVNASPELVDTNLTIDQSYINKNAKLAKVLEDLEEIHERGEKVLIFSNWVEPLRTFYRFISKKYKTCCFTGTMSSADREKHKQVFLNNPEYTVMMGTIGAMGTSHTFTVAQNIIFIDEPWNPSDREQACDRIYRIGTTKSVNIYTVLAKDTVDDRVHNILYTKEQISKYVVDGKLDLRKNPELFDLLLGDTRTRK